MKPATVLYLPPPAAYASATALLDNLQQYPAKGELIVFSEHDYKLPGQIVLKRSPDEIKNEKKFAINNLIWLSALRIAKSQGISHMLYLEADCRVADGWDAKIFEDYFSLGRPCIAAGTLAVYNPCSAGKKAAKRWEDLVAMNWRRNIPVATYGWMPANQSGPSCVFPNGALAVYDVMWMEKLFDLDKTAKTAVEIGPFDMELGIRVWKEFADESYDVLGYLSSVYSGYGDALTTEEERLGMLRDGKVVAVHQCKGVGQP